MTALAGDVLAQKRKGEEALAASGIPYTVVRPGGLLDAPRSGNDKLRLSQGDTDFGYNIIIIIIIIRYIIIFFCY